MPAKILIVEDNEMNRDMLSRRLQRRGYDICVAVDGVEGLDAARTQMPDLILMDMSLAALEGGRHGFAFGSGLAALDTLLKLLSEGDHVVCGENVYGGTHRQMTHVWARLGLRFTFVDPSDPQRIADAVRPGTKLVYAETPTNPMMRLCDLAAAGEIARRAGALFAVDNTFATPYLQRPLELGADLVVHSTTKYLGGHSDVVGGAIIGRDRKMGGKLAYLQNAVGAVPGPLQDLRHHMEPGMTRPVRIGRMTAIDIGDQGDQRILKNGDRHEHHAEGSAVHDFPSFKCDAASERSSRVDVSSS